MDKPINKAIRFVFKYLNSKELHNAFLVCKIWWKIGKSENKLRAPLYIEDNREKTNHKMSLSLLKDPYIKSIKPSLYMLVTNHEPGTDLSVGCHCRILPSNCYSITAEIRPWKNQKNKLSCLILPNSPNIHINTYSFITRRLHSSTTGYHCIETYTDYDKFLRSCDELNEHFKPFFETTRSSTSCLILWCEGYNFYWLIQFIQLMETWFPYSRMVSWGGVMDHMRICNFVHRTRRCTSPADFAFIFISGQNMEVKSLILDQNSIHKVTIDKKLRKFRETIELKEHSMAFMYISYLRYDIINDLESTLFKQYFPNVKLFQVFGTRAMGGTGLFEIIRMEPKPFLLRNSHHTTLMLLTYN